MIQISSFLLRFVRQILLHLLIETLEIFSFSFYDPDRFIDPNKSNEKQKNDSFFFISEQWKYQAEKIPHSTSMKYHI